MTHKGMFDWKVLEMCFSLTGDKFYCVMDRIMKNAAGLKNFTRQVDDILLWANSMEELVEQIECFLWACKENFVSLSPRKTELALDETETIDFRGKNISADGIGLTQDRMKALQDFPAPQSRKDVQSLIHPMVPRIGWTDMQDKKAFKERYKNFMEPHS